MPAEIGPARLFAVCLLDCLEVLKVANQFAGRAQPEKEQPASRLVFSIVMSLEISSILYSMGMVSRGVSLKQPEVQGYQLVKKARHDLVIVIGLLRLEEMSETVSGKKDGRHLAHTRHNRHATAWGCRPDEFTTTKEQGLNTLTWRGGGRTVSTWCLMQVPALFSNSPY